MIEEIKSLAHNPSLKGIALLFFKPILTYVALTILFSFLQGIAPIGAVPSLPPPSIPPITPVPGAPPTTPPSVPGAPAPTAPVLTDTLALSDTAGVWLSASPVSMDALSFADSIALTVTNPQTGSSTTITQTTEGGSSTSPASSSSSTSSSGETPSNILPWADWVDSWGWYISYVDAIEGNRLLVSTLTDELALEDAVSFPIGHPIAEKWTESLALQDTASVTAVAQSQYKPVSYIENLTVTDVGASLSLTPWTTVPVNVTDEVAIDDNAILYSGRMTIALLDELDITDSFIQEAYQQVYIEDWNIQAQAQVTGGYGQVFGEDWGYSPPPNYSSVYTENWTQ